MTLVINIPLPELQINFSFALGKIRCLYLQDALGETIEKVDILTIDKQLAIYVPKKKLTLLAKHGLRGELVYPVPCLLEKNPYLLGYYRLLLGFSQKEFYTAKFGLTSFKTMETKGILSDKNKTLLPALCKALITSAVSLIEGICINRISKEILDDLTLLTVGPQLRGGANVKKGIACIADVFQAIHKIVQHATIKSDARKIEITNAARRTVYIEFASDPDIVIREEIGPNNFRNIVAIEIKGGVDFSNIHNRIGEAEKSHQKAKQAGYVEFWTIVNVDRIDLKIAGKESPTTNTFYKLSDIKSMNGNDYQNFMERIVSLTGIRKNDG